MKILNLVLSAVVLAASAVLLAFSIVSICKKDEY